MDSLRALCVQMSQIQAEKVHLEEELAEVNKQFDQLRLVQIPQLMESLGPPPSPRRRDHLQVRPGRNFRFRATMSRIRAGQPR
jgi:hypothetical protein